MTPTRERMLSSLLFLGGCLLVFRAYSMLAGGAREVLVSWVYMLLITELILDIAALLTLARWFVLFSDPARRLALQVTALVVVLHGIRVGVFALGRIGPWKDFDVQLAARASHADRWTWMDVGLATTLSGASVLILLWILALHRR